jgi:hypothetical protein
MGVVNELEDISGNDDTCPLMNDWTVAKWTTEREGLLIVIATADYAYLLESVS